MVLHSFCTVGQGQDTSWGMTLIFTKMNHNFRTSPRKPIALSSNFRWPLVPVVGLVGARPHVLINLRVCSLTHVDATFKCDLALGTGLASNSWHRLAEHTSRAFRTPYLGRLKPNRLSLTLGSVNGSIQPCPALVIGLGNAFRASPRSPHRSPKPRLYPRPPFANTRPQSSLGFNDWNGTAPQ